MSLSFYFFPPVLSECFFRLYLVQIQFPLLLPLLQPTQIFLPLLPQVPPQRLLPTPSRILRFFADPTIREGVGKRRPLSRAAVEVGVADGEVGIQIVGIDGVHVDVVVIVGMRVSSKLLGGVLRRSVLRRLRNLMRRPTTTTRGACARVQIPDRNPPYFPLLPTLPVSDIPKSFLKIAESNGI